MTFVSQPKLRITPIAYPLDQNENVSLPSVPVEEAPIATVPPKAKSHPSRIQKKKEDPKKKSHWMTNAGFQLYAVVGAIKTVSSLKRGFEFGNPTLLLGNTALLASFPAVFWSHGFYAKAFMLVANHLSEMAEATIGYNDRVTAEAHKAREKGYAVPPLDIKGIKGFQQWFNRDLLKRTLRFRNTTNDKHQFKEATAFIVNDLKYAAKQLRGTLHAGGQWIKEASKKVVNPQYKMKWPERFKVDSLPSGSLENIKIQKNIYHAETTGAFGGIVGVMIETVADSIGVNHVAKIFTRPALLVANLLQTTAALCGAKQLYFRPDAQQKKSPKFKNMAYQEAGGVVLEAVGAASWSNDWLLGIYRIGSALRMPYRKHKTKLTTNEAGQVVELKILTPAVKKALFTEDLSFVADVVAAGLILGAPLIAWWEAKHRKSLNPVERLKSRPKQEAKPKASSKIQSVSYPRLSQSKAPVDTQNLKAPLASQAFA